MSGKIIIIDETWYGNPLIFRMIEETRLSLVRWKERHLSDMSIAEQRKIRLKQHQDELQKISKRNR